MRYSLRGNIMIRSENAAKPASQASGFVKQILSTLPYVGNSFDYGCGKLRYLTEIQQTCKNLMLIDSEIQLSRSQIIHGKQTSIRAMVDEHQSVAACNVSEFERYPTQFERAFCINVLSVVPIESIRKRIIRIIKNKLCSGACCLYVIQYRNSYFNQMRKAQNSTVIGDGILMDSLRGHSYYALIRPDSLRALLQDAGYEIIDTTLNDGSVYMWGRV